MDTVFTRVAVVARVNTAVASTAVLFVGDDRDTRSKPVVLPCGRWRGKGGKLELKIATHVSWLGIWLQNKVGRLCFL